MLRAVLAICLLSVTTAVERETASPIEVVPSKYAYYAHDK